MSTRVAEKRRSPRTPAVYPAAILDNDGYLLAWGRTSDISESGVFIIAETQWQPQIDARVTIEIKLPGFPQERRRDKPRFVMYEARVVRTQEIGHLIGVGLELLNKLR